jgi:hypothetical protein
MDLDEAALGPRSPLMVTPARPPGSVRRTSNIDTVRPLAPDTVRAVDARARDLTTAADGEVVSQGSVHLTARVDAATYGLLELSSDPSDPRLAELIGATVASGFRRRLLEALADDDDRTSLTGLLLDDFTGAQLVAGYDMVHRQSTGGPQAKLIPVMDIRSRIDLCAGWANDSALIEGLRHDGEVPVVTGPVAPLLEAPDDADSWHPMAPLPPGAMRRRRRLDVLAAVDGVHSFEAHFRDSHVSDDGEETIVHEYLVTGLVDAGSRTLVTVDATARVLPYSECPGALGSAGQVVGWSLDQLRRTVHRELVGTSSCTHLNDTLRSLADLDVLLDQVS